MFSYRAAEDLERGDFVSLTPQGARKTMYTRAEYDTAIAEAVAAEREACAKIADNANTTAYDHNGFIADEIAAAIRKRGE